MTWYMPVVSNTSPILNLAIIGRLSLLRDQFGEIWIPPGVLDELRVKEELPGSRVIREALEAGWLHLREVEDEALVRVLRRDLDRGEAEVIALAVQMKAERVLLDEREGRRVAKSVGLKVTDVLGILLRARLEGKLSSLRIAMQELKTKAGCRISADLLAEILKESGEEERGDKERER